MEGIEEGIEDGGWRRMSLNCDMQGEGEGSCSAQRHVCGPLRARARVYVCVSFHMRANACVCNYVWLT